jgi:hypothetical protein
MKADNQHLKKYDYEMSHTIFETIKNVDWRITSDN